MIHYDTLQNSEEVNNIKRVDIKYICRNKGGEKTGCAKRRRYLYLKKNNLYRS